MARRWTFEACMESAAPFLSKMEWAKNYPGAVKAAKRENWYDACCKHMLPQERGIKRKWTFETCRNDAQNYKFPAEWRKASRSAYDKALAKGWLDYCCEHMNVWSVAACKKEAKRFSSLKEWQDQSPGSFQCASDKGIVNRCSTHMVCVDDRFPIRINFSESSFTFPVAYDSPKARLRLRKYQVCTSGLRTLFDSNKQWLLWNDERKQRNFTLAVRHIFNGETLQSLGDELGCSRENIRLAIAKVCSQIQNLNHHNDESLVDDTFDLQQVHYLKNICKHIAGLKQH